MSVRLNRSNTFKLAVKFNLIDANGKPELQTFTGEFKRLDRDAIAALVAEMKDDMDGLQKVLIGWDLKDETGDAVAFSEESFAAFCKIPGASGTTMLTYFENVGASRIKN